MALTNDTFADAMKTFYIGPLNELVYQTQAFLNRVEKTGEDVAGNFALVPVVTGRNNAVGSRKDTSGVGPSLPAHGRQTYDAYTFKMGYHYGRGSISGPVMRNSRSNAGAFAKVLDTEMKGLMKSLPSMMNRQLWSYGHGRAATIASTTTSTTVTTVEVYSTGIMSAKIGDRVCIAVASSGATIAPASGALVTAISRDKTAAGVASTTKHTLTLDTAPGRAQTLDTDAVYFGGGEVLAAANISRAQEIYGVPALIDDGNIGADEPAVAAAGEILDGSLNLGSVDRSTISAAQSIVLQGSTAGVNRAVTVTLFEEAFLQFQHIAGGDVNSLEIYTNPGLWATFGLLHIGDRRYNDYKEKVEGGFTAIMYNGRPIFADRDAPRDIYWFIDMSNIMLLTQSGFELMDDDGNVLNRIADKDAYEFTLYRDAQLGLRNGRTHVKLDDCSTVFNVEANI